MRFKEVKRLIKEDEQKDVDLLEVNMSPGNLERLAKSIQSQAGMEFEMIVPDAVQNDGDYDVEYDWDADETVADIDDVIRFFDENDENSSRELARARNQMQEDYSNWAIEAADKQWERDKVERIYEYLKSNASADEIAEILDTDVDSIDYSAAAELVAEKEIEPYYEDAQNSAMDDFMNDIDSQTEWFRDEGMRYMSDVRNNYDLNWPYFQDPEPAGVSVDEVADAFSKAIGRPVNASSSYHGGRREAGTYVVEPDGSLEPDDSADGGLEFVSPPLELDELLSDLDKVKAWADKTGCYTNDSTGLHINVSVPNMSTATVDYVKLALLLGDKYVLDQFGRAGNTYCKSAMDEVKNRIKSRPEDAAALLKSMKSGLGALATKVIHSGETHKYTSINTKGNYVEFRSPGGDWLNDNTFRKIKPTLLRFIVALDAAMDPAKYRDEYLKKLYAVLQPKSKDDTLSYFARYASGQLPKAALKSFVKQAQLERSLTKGGQGGQMWWRVDKEGRGNDGASIQVVASSKEEALDKAAIEWRTSTSRLINADVYPIGKYEGRPASSTAPTVAGRPSNPDGDWILALRGQNSPVPVYRFMASGVDDANTVMNQWDEEHSGQHVVMHYDPSKQYGQPQGPSAPIPGSTLDLQRQRAAQQTGNWGIWITSGDRFVRMPGTGDASNASLRRFPSRDAAEQFLAQTREANPNMRSDIEIREIPAGYQLPGQPAPNNLIPHGPGPWEVYKLDTGETYHSLTNSDRIRAHEEAARMLAHAQRVLTDYGVRTRQNNTSQPTPTSTTPGQAQQTFTGQWNVLVGGQHVWRVQGENQGIANAAAREWLRHRSPEFNQEHQGQEVEVVPFYN